jgi:ribonuclease HII
VFVAGIDENGLGPRLGPLVVTGVLLETSTYDPKRWRRVLRRVGVDDSKKVAAFGAVEGAARVATEAAVLATGGRPETFGDLVRAVSREGEAWMRAPCPSEAAPQCWTEAWRLPAPTGRLARALARLDARLVALTSSILCPSRYNDSLETAPSKLGVDLALFEGVVLDLRDRAGVDTLFLCGKVGGRTDYDVAFGSLAGYLRTTLLQKRKRSAYKLLGIGEVHFVMDGDASEPPIALASVVGKVLREGFVDRMNRFYSPHVEDLAPASGYYDPVTDVFVDRTARVRRRLAIPDRCFLRIR